MSVQLQYNYAHIDPETGLCETCLTFSYEVNHPEWVAVGPNLDDYIGKYYLNGSWYEDAEGTIPWDPEA